MPTIINDPYSGNVFGRIGKSVGQGLSEQLPKEVERRRLSNSLESLGSSNENLTPLQQGAQLIRGGFTPEQVQQYLPMLQQQNMRQEYLNANQRSARSASEQNQISSSSRPNKMNAAKLNRPQEPGSEEVDVHAPKENGFVSPEAVTEYKSSILQKPEKADVEQLAREKYLPRDPYMTISQAEALAREELNENIESQKAANQALRSDLNTRMALDLQGSGLGDFKDISGEIQKTLLDQGEHMVNVQGFTPEEASERLSNIALELGKTANATKETGSFWNSFRSSKKKEQELRDQKKEFDKYGFGEHFDNIAAAQLGITRLQAAHVLDPLKNKKIESEIGSLKKIPGTSDKKLKDEQLDSIVKSISPKDNLYAIEYLLRDKGYDVNQFKQRVSKLASEKQIALTDQQKRQNKATVSNSFLGDILFQSF